MHGAILHKTAYECVMDNLPVTFFNDLQWVFSYYIILSQLVTIADDSSRCSMQIMRGPMLLTERSVKRRRRMTKGRCKSAFLLTLWRQKRQKHLQKISNLSRRAWAMLVPQCLPTQKRRQNTIGLTTKYFYSINILVIYKNLCTNNSV